MIEHLDRLAGLWVRFHIAAVVQPDRFGIGDQLMAEIRFQHVGHHQYGRPCIHVRLRRRLPVQRSTYVVIMRRQIIDRQNPEHAHTWVEYPGHERHGGAIVLLAPDSPE